MKFLVKLMLLYLGVLLFFSCQPQGNVVGKYTISQKGKYPQIIPITFNIELNSDSTFAYNYRGGFHGEVSTGFWKIDKRNKQIMLYSFIQDLRKIPVAVTISKDKNHHFPLFVFDNRLKLDSSIKWELNVNSTNYPLNADSLVLLKGIVVDSFYIKGYNSFKDTSYTIIPFLLQDTIQSERCYLKDTSNNVYHIAFPSFVDYNIFHYKPLHDSLKLNRNMLFFRGVKLHKQ